MKFDEMNPAFVAAARHSPAGFAYYATRGRYMLARHIRFMDEEITPRLKAGGARILLETPPRHGKTTMISVATPAWYVGHYPDREVAMASATHSLASRNSAKARAWFRASAPLVFGQELASDHKAKDDWAPEGRDGEVKAYGVGTQIHGRGAHLLLLDDLVAGSEVIRSDSQMDTLWEWVQEDAWTRLYPESSVLSVITRWAEDDPHGRFLTEMPNEDWTVLKLPAVAEDDDLLGRMRGEPLWPKWFPIEWLDKVKESSSTYGWNAKYQQRPTPEEGGIFKRSWWTDDAQRYVSVDGGYRSLTGVNYRREDMSVMMFVDLAFTEKKRGDRTCLVVVGVTSDCPKKMILLDVRTMMIPASSLIPEIRSAMTDWGVRQIYVERAGPQVGFVDLMSVDGLPIKTVGRSQSDDLRLSGDKEATWHEASPFMRNGRMLIPASAPWLADWEHEMLVAPNGAHDDQVDPTAWACLRVSAMTRLAFGPVSHTMPKHSRYAGMLPGSGLNQGPRVRAVMLTRDPDVDQDVDRN